MAQAKIEDIYPLSPMQQGMLFHTLLDPESPAYHERSTFTVEGELDVEAVTAAWRHLAGCHPLFRTVFRWEGVDEPVQIVLRAPRAEVTVHDLRECDAEDLQSRLDALDEAGRGHRFDLARGPLMRLEVCRLPGGRHRFVWSYHHILMDGWCLSLLMQDFFLTYMAVSAGAIPPVLSRPRYRDYINYLKLKHPEEAAAYWRSLLHDFETPSGLPAEATGAAGIERSSLRIGAELTAAIQASARDLSCTMGTVVQAAWALVLSRAAGLEDVVFGVTVAGRPPELDGADEMLGLFINTLPVRVRLTQEMSGRELLADLRRQVAAISEHSSSFLPEIKAASAVDRAAPLFDSIVVFENYPFDGAALGDELTVVEQKTDEFTSLDTTLIVVPGEGLKFELAWDGGRHRRQTMNQHLVRLTRVLKRIAETPDRRFDDLDLLLPAERSRLLQTFNATARPYELICPVHLFERRAAECPEALAMVTSRGAGLHEVTYGELNARANRIARKLLSSGLQPEDRVGLMVHRHPDLPAAILGIHKAGGCYVPMDPAYPRARLNYMLDDARCRVLVSESSCVTALEEAPPETLLLDVDDLADLDPANPGPVARPRGLSHLIYTSGSTGAPKGVMLEHGNVAAFLAWCREEFAPEEYAALIASTSMCFDLSVFELFLPLTSGNCLVLLDSPLDLNVWLENHGATMINTVPSALRHLLASATRRHRVRAINLAGEPLSAELVREAYEKLDVDIIRNLYGPTEDTTYSTCWRVPRDLREEPLIGRPIANTTLFVLDRRHRLVPEGSVGEICLGGANLARGYFEAPEKNAERFITSALDGQRLYRTGDLGRFRPDGEVEFHGRLDHQVKIRGNRVELGEIETRLRAFDEVGEVVVADRRDVAGDVVLAAWYTARQDIPPGEFRTFLRETLPEYMVPSYFVRLEALPLTLSGKVDRARLPEPGVSDTLRPYTAPRNDAEAALAAIWAEVLGVERVGIEDNFFDLGGHSLTATRTVARIKRELGMEISLKNFFAHPTVAECAGINEGEGGLPPVTPQPDRSSFPCSHAQERLWFLEQMNPGSPAYHMPSVFALPGPLDLEILRRAFTLLVARHASLRTVFATVDDEPVQVVLDQVALDMKVIETTADLSALLVEEVGRPFDLVAGPLFRLRLVSRNGGWLVIFVLHHIIADGWTLEVLLRELLAAYGAMNEGNSPAFESLDVQYGDYALWQRELLADGALEEQGRWWRERLVEAPRAELPADHARPAVQTSNGALYRLDLGEELSSRVRTTAADRNLTPFMVLLAGINVWLSRLSGETDVLVGTPVAGRSRPELEPLAGLFVNTVALRTDLAGAPSFDEVCSRVRETCVEAYSRQEYPFDRLVDELRVSRDTGRTPLFSVMVTWQDAAPFAELARLAEEVPLDAVAAKFDLTLFCVDPGAAVKLIFEYNRDLYTEETMERYGRCLVRILEDALAAPGADIKRVRLLDEAGRRLVVEDFNRTARAWPRDRSLTDLFVGRVAAHPQREALFYEGETLTYAQLSDRAARIARTLAARGVRRGDRVLMACRSPLETAPAILGVLMAGAAYVPADTDYPRTRLDFLCRSAAVRAVITTTDHEQLFEGRVTLCVDREEDWLDARTALPRVEAGDIAYIIYTSGSTGTPKGVAVTHRAVMNLVHGLGEEIYRFHEEPLRVGLLAAYTFDASVQQIFGSLLQGHTLCPVPTGMKRDAGALHDYIVRASLEVLDGTPSLWEVLVEGGLQDEPSLDLKHVIVGGEALSCALVRRFREGAPQVRWTNVYGVTEAAVDSTACTVTEDDLDGGQVPIGAPMANTRVYILGLDDEPLPVGVPGEICIAGEGLGMGYVGEPEKTAQAFVPDPFHPGRTMYRTGDRGRWLEDGRVDFLGRSDFQVKIRGFRIEPGEIEAALRQHPGLQDVVVIARTDRAGELGLVAYIAAADPPAVEHVRAFLTQSLPAYMVPDRFVTLSALPLNLSGKVDRSRLPEPGAPDAGSTAPRNPREAAVARGMAAVLGLEAVGVHDNFFDLGGHSLRATRLAARLAREEKITVQLRDIFEHPTAAGLAALEEGADALPPVTPRRGDEILPLSSAQRRIWFLEQMSPGGSAFNIPLVFELEERPEIEELEEAMTLLVRRHESMRTVFAGVDGEPVQIVREPEDVHLELEPELDISAEISRPFDLEKGPLWRLRLVDRKPRVLVVGTLHHLIADGWSLEILAAEFAEALRAVRAGEEPRWQDLPVQYGDYALWQQRLLHEGALAEQGRWWRERLGGDVPYSELPADRPRPAVRTTRGALLRTSLAPDAAERLRAVAREQGLTPFMVLLSAVNIWLSRLGGEEDVVVGTPVAGRERPELQGLAGMFAATLALRTDLSGAGSFAEVCSRVRTTCVEAYARQDYPFDLLVEQLQVTRDTSRTPLFSTMVSWQEDAGALDGALRPVELAGLSAKFDLTLFCVDNPEGTDLAFEYNTDLFSPETLGRFARALLHLLDQALERPHAPLPSLTLLDEPGRAEVLELFNATTRVYPRDKSIMELFAAQAAMHPERTALLAGEEELSYAELLAEATRRARVLADHGVVPGSRVLLLTRDARHTVPAMLAILAAGAAYVPADPAFPAERLRYLAGGSGAVLALIAGDHPEQLPDLPVLRLDVDADWPTVEARLPETAPGDGAYVIYTSGSTGEPKGVSVPHRGVVNLVYGLNERVYRFLEEPLRVGLLAAYTFDASVQQIFGALLLGHTLCPVPAELKRDVRALRRHIVSCGLQVLDGTPSLWEVLTQAGLQHAEGLALKHVIVGGEVLPSALIRRFGERSVRWTNVYGLTEAAVDSTACTVSAEDLDREYVPIGTPLINTRLYILGAHDEPLPVGVPGEICVAGDGLASGYLGDDERTRHSFVPDPFHLGEVMYRTGDLGRWLPGGQVEFLGRSDLQIKLSGYRIEPGEIEAALLHHPEIVEVAAGARDGMLVAWYAARRDCTAEELRTWLNERLPSYLVPARWEQMETLPVNQSGKVDRKRLPAPGRGDAHAYVPPADELEQMLCDAWTAALQVERVGVNDNFFDLGGHSLLVMKILSRMSLPLTIQDFFDHQTVADLAGAVRGRLSREAETLTEVEEPEVEPVDIRLGGGRERPEQILLTGATGFMGSFLLDELLQRTEARLCCLVRGATEDEAEQRLYRAWSHAHGARRLPRERVAILTGELTMDGLGLADAGMLSGCDTVVHAAGLVQHFGHREEFEAVNVRGTARLLELTPAARRWHHISSLSVSGDYVPGHAGIFFRETDRDRGQVITGVYARSKYEAERLVAARAESTIYRVGNLVGAHDTGVFQANVEQNAFYGLLRALLSLGVVPPADETLVDLTPVDACGRAVVTLSQLPETAGRTLHVFHPRRLDFSTLTRIFETIGYSFDTAGPDLADTDGQRREALEFALGYLAPGGVPRSRVLYDARMSGTCLAQTGFVWPELDTAFFRRLIGGAGGYFPAPAGQTGES